MNVVETAVICIKSSALWPFVVRICSGHSKTLSKYSLRKISRNKILRWAQDNEDTFNYIKRWLGQGPIEFQGIIIIIIIDFYIWPFWRHDQAQKFINIGRHISKVWNLHKNCESHNCAKSLSRAPLFAAPAATFTEVLWLWYTYVSLPDLPKSL